MGLDMLGLLGNDSAPFLSTATALGATDVGSGPDHDENGVDLTLIRHSLSLTPTERLKAVENFMNAMAFGAARFPSGTLEAHEVDGRLRSGPALTRLE
jgi:hypothetical protein